MSDTKQVGGGVSHEFRFNGMSSHERTKQMQDTLTKGTKAIQKHGIEKATAVLVAAIFQDGSMILEGAGPAGAIGQLGMMIVVRSDESGGAPEIPKP